MKKTVYVTSEVVVSIDREKFDEEFMKEFRDSFYPFHTIDQHIEHLAQLYARGLCDNHSFIEGYGPAADMGIRFDLNHIESEIA